MMCHYVIGSNMTAFDERKYYIIKRIVVIQINIY